MTASFHKSSEVWNTDKIAQIKTAMKALIDCKAVEDHTVIKPEYTKRLAILLSYIDPPDMPGFKEFVDEAKQQLGVD